MLASSKAHFTMGRPRLSETRRCDPADAVSVPAELTAKACGDSKPVADDAAEEGRAKNAGGTGQDVIEPAISSAKNLSDP
jgi:hypothetical protein